MKHLKILIITFIIFIMHLPAYSATPTPVPPKKTMLSDGVEYWQRVNTNEQKSWFWQLIEALTHVVLGNADELPFGKSTAFLVGVGNYQQLRDLSFVANDLEALRINLLGMGGFDEVYVVKDAVATPELVKRYMQETFKKLDAKSRLLFYYSGHGDDFGGGTGYMQFSAARPGDSVSNVLEIDLCKNWSKMLPAKHILFIFDCCVSGLSFSIGKGNTGAELATTFSGNGSRLVLTAGTGDEKSFGVEEHSIFTSALLAALENSQPQNNGLLTLAQVYGDLQNRVALYCTEYQCKMTPKLWEIPDINKNYTGTFVFIDPKIADKDFSSTYKTQFSIKKGEDRTDEEVSIILPAVKNKLLVVMPDEPQLPSSNIKATPIPDVLILSTNPILLDYMVKVEGGIFPMGSEAGYDDDEKPVHQVKVDTFYISKHEVTQEQYLEFCSITKANYPEWLEAGHKYNIQTDTNTYYKKFCGTGKEQYPIVGIDWYNATAYCNWLSTQQGLTPCYSGSGDHITCNFNANGYRLPTEAEWEYAARGGNKSKGFEFSRSNTANAVAWYDDNSGGTTHPVGKLMANELGLFDMSGNVWEWCWDRYGSYTDGSQENPRGPATGVFRVVRGGCWYSLARLVRAAYRIRYQPAFRWYSLGFRLARG